MRSDVAGCSHKACATVALVFLVGRFSLQVKEFVAG